MINPCCLCKVFNLRHALTGAAIMGFLVALGNSSSGAAAACKAATVQAVYSFFIIGVNMALHEKLTRVSGRSVSVVIPSLTTTVLAGGLHAFADTPNMVITLTTVFISALVGFLFWSEVGERFHTIDPVVLVRRFIVARNSRSGKKRSGESVL